jgi:CRISPR-associated protein Cmr1
MTRPAYTRIAGEIPVKQKVDPNYITQIRTYKLITPLFGGGAETQKPDEVTTVRASEVRGHLRFWWRACKASEFSSIEEMQQTEEKIWGSTKLPSEVTVSVTVPSNSTIKREPAFKVIKENDKKKTKFSSNIAPYAAFPLLPDKDEEKQVGWKSEDILLDVVFKLEIQYPNNPKIVEQIEAALWAWETFGGIGARTRRGFGSLQCMEKNGIPIKAPEKQKVQNEIKANLAKYVSEKECQLDGVPHLIHDLRFVPVAFAGDEKTVWKNMIKSLKNFRQSRQSGEHQISHWPEANSIRNIFKGDEDISDKTGKFPRAKLGLPILFHMPHDKGIPDSLSLQGKEIKENKYIDRLASPLIIRPIACSDGAVGLAAILEWNAIDSEESYTPPGGLILKGAPNNPKVESNLSESEAKNIPPLDGEPDVLQAFLDYLK